MRKEEWRTIEEYNGIYKVSSLGRVKSLDRKTTRSDGVTVFNKGKILVQRINDRGYLEVKLSQSGKGAYKKVHRLVAKAFIPNPENKEEVNHMDGNKENNSVDNLEWATHSENQKHAHSTGLYNRKGSGNGQAILNEGIVREIRKARQNGEKLKEAYKKYEKIIGISCFKSVWYGNSWKHVK